MAKKKVGVRDSSPIRAVNRKLDRILKNQSKILSSYKEELEESEKVESLERKELKEEAKELKHLQELETLEEEVKKQVEPHPLRRITYHDIAKGIVGSFFGVVAHYTFIYGIKVAAEIDMVRATLLYPLSFFVGGVFLYATGFRKVKGKRILIFLPLRLVVLYLTAVAVSILTLFIFYPHFATTFADAYKQVAAVSLTAIIGACTADLIGKE